LTEDTEELQEQLELWNNTKFTYPYDKPLQALFEGQAIAFADKIAVFFLEQTLTYKELNETANQLANVLLGSGIQKGDTVGLAVDRSEKMVIALLAILKAGAAYVPIDLEYPPQRIDFMLRDAGAKVLLTSKEYKGLYHSQAKEMLLEDALEKGKEHSKSNPGLDVDEKDLAYIIYTSGTTGSPKGVMIGHGNIVNLLCSMQQKQIMNENDRLLAVTTIAFDIAGLELFLPLITGAQVVITNELVCRDGFALLETIKKKGISIIQATPLSYKIMLAAGWKEKLDLKILCCGEPMPLSLARDLIPRCRALYNYYGPTETTIYSTGTEITAKDEIITIGKPIGNTQIYILDDGMNLLPPGKEGIIYIAGAGVGKGYVNLPELTKAAFVDNPFASGEKMFRTGDLGKWIRDGNIYFIGRVDQQLKIRGYRIEPATIEAVLLSQQEIQDAVVIAREDVPDNKVLVAYIVLKKDSAVAPGSTDAYINKWRKAIQDKLPLFMIPNDLVVLDRFPVLSSGKVDRKALPKPNRDDRADDKKYSPPISEMDKKLERVWAKALGLERVGIDDDFFELGGHSLIAVLIMGEIEKATGKRLPINTLFISPTIRQISKLLGSDNADIVNRCVVPIEPKGTKPPLFIVHGDGLNVMIFNSMGKKMSNDQPVFGIQAKGLNGTDDTYDDLKKIAAYYISEVLLEYPDGPYCLAGYSFGGVVAFEMAKQFQQMGKKVDMLAMFDTEIGNVDFKASPLSRLGKKIWLQFPKMLFIVKSLFYQPRDILQYQGYVMKRKYRYLLGRLGLQKTDEAEKMTPHEKNIVKKHLIAYQNYDLSPYSGRIDLFRVKKRVYFLQDPITLGWSPYAEKGVQVHEIPGDHKTFLLPPNDKVFANTLQSVIDERINSTN